jgi:hypothetical protein
MENAPRNNQTPLCRHRKSKGVGGGGGWEEIISTYALYDDISTGPESQ